LLRGRKPCGLRRLRRGATPAADPHQIEGKVSSLSSNGPRTLTRQFIASNVPRSFTTFALITLHI